MKKNKWLSYMVWFFVQIILCYFLYIASDLFFYSEKMLSLVIPCLLIVVLVANTFVFFKKYTHKKDVLSRLFIFVCCIFLVYAFIYSCKVIQAVRYSNSYELLNLSNNYSIKKAKKIKYNVEDIFEYDEYGIFSRNIKISNFYKDEDFYILYIDDFYNSYRLKFYVLLENNNIKEVFWDFNGDKLYFVKDFKKTVNFEYYYAMYIVNNVYGEEINYDDSLAIEIEKQISNKFDSLANTMFHYEELTYDKYNDNFNIMGDVYCMDYYGHIEESKFEIEFKRKSLDQSRDTIYYGDFSFGYIDWDISM